MSVAERRERLAFWVGLSLSVAAFAGAAFLAGPRTPLSWVLIVASGPASAAVVGVWWMVLDRKAKLVEDNPDLDELLHATEASDG